MTIDLIEDAESLTLCSAGCGARVTVEAETCRSCQRIAMIDPPKPPKGIRRESFKEDATVASLVSGYFRKPTPLRKRKVVEYEAVESGE